MEVVLFFMKELVRNLNRNAKFACRWPLCAYHDRFGFQAYGLAGRWEDALALLPRAAALAADEQESGNQRAAVPDERMYCSVINAMGESGAWEAAVELIQSMRRRPSAAAAAAGSSSGTSDSRASGAAAAGVSPSLEPPPPGRAAYGCACRACARKGEWGAVLGLMEDMREDGLERDSSVYASAMRAFVEAGDWERAVETVTVEVSKGGRGTFISVWKGCHGLSPWRVNRFCPKDCWLVFSLFKLKEGQTYALMNRGIGA